MMSLLFGITRLRLLAGRYLFLNAIANQLRYPNSHTNYFLNLILYLFAEANTPAIQEQITRYVGWAAVVGRGRDRSPGMSAGQRWWDGGGTDHPVCRLGSGGGTGEGQITRYVGWAAVVGRGRDRSPGMSAG